MCYNSRRPHQVPLSAKSKIWVFHGNRLIQTGQTKKNTKTKTNGWWFLASMTNTDFCSLVDRSTTQCYVLCGPRCFPSHHSCKEEVILDFLLAQTSLVILLQSLNMVFQPADPIHPIRHQRSTPWLKLLKLLNHHLHVFLHCAVD